MIRHWLIFYFFFQIIALPGSAISSQPLPFPLNEWIDISTPDKPLVKSKVPAILKQYVGGYTHAQAFRVKLAPGEIYTFQTEYPADNKYAQVTIYGTNPFSAGRSISNPPDTSWIGISRARSFPGGDIKGYRFGRQGNFKVSEKSEHNYAFLIIAGYDPNIAIRCKIIHPALPDDRIRKQGGYRIKPDGTKTFSWGSVKETPIWLGYANGAPHLPFQWELDAEQTQVNVAGIWETKSGDLSLLQDGQKVDGHYPTDNGVVTGILKGNVFSGYWIEDKSNQRCPTKIKGRHYWGKMRLVFEDDRFTGSWDYCGQSTATSGWDGKRNDATLAAGASVDAQTPKSAAKSVDESWRELPDFEFELIGN